MKKYYYAFVGSNATIGRANPNTGRYSIHGELKQFTSKKERDLYCLEYDYNYNSYPKPTNKREAKVKYFAGDTQKQFNELIAYMDSE